jgi:type VI protein secretion system component VasK
MATKKKKLVKKAVKRIPLTPEQKRQKRMEEVSTQHLPRLREQLKKFSAGDDKAKEEAANDILAVASTVYTDFWNVEADSIIKVARDYRNAVEETRVAKLKAELEEKKKSLIGKTATLIKDYRFLGGINILGRYINSHLHRRKIPLLPITQQTQQTK